MEDAKILRDVEISAREYVWLKGPILPAIHRRRDVRHANNHRKVLEQLDNTGSVRCAFERDGQRD